jgi:uncharacterized protein (TIGR02996 family)
MTDEDFVREILAHPNDDFLRSVYADWLEEQGDRRSDFLRLEIALACANPTGAERDELEARMEESGRGIEWSWLRAVSRAVIDKGARIDFGDVNSIGFRFLETLYDRGKGTKGGFSPQAIGSELGLSDNEIKDVIQYLTPLRMIEWRSGSRQIKTSASLNSSVVISAKGRAHVKAMLGLPLDRKALRNRTPREGKC